jgi:hypothetical protein
MNFFVLEKHGGSLSSQNGAASSYEYTVNMLNKQPRMNEMGGPPAWWFGMGLTIIYCKK